MPADGSEAMTAGEWTEAAEEPQQQEEEIDSSVDEPEVKNAGLDADIDANEVVELEEAGDS